MSDAVENPRHYNSHPSGVEVADVIDSMPPCLFNAWKYVARAGLKENAVEDMRKAIWYLRREILRRARPGHVRFEGDDPHNTESFEKFHAAEPNAELRKFYKLLWMSCIEENDRFLTSAISILEDRIEAMEGIEAAAKAT